MQLRYRLPEVHDRRAVGRVLDALRLQLSQSVIPLYRVDQEGDPDQFGSGVLFRLGQRAFILTAYHVWHDRREETGDPKLDSHIHTTSGGGHMVQLPSTFERGRSSDVSESEREDPLDVAFAELTPPMVVALTHRRCVAPHELDTNDVSDASNEYVVVGYPALRGRNLPPALGGPTAPSTIYRGVNVPIVEYRDAAHAASILRLRVKLRHQLDIEGNLRTAPFPKGVSGGGVWRLPREYMQIANGDPQAISSAARLVGIFHSAPAKGDDPHTFIATRISLFNAALATYDPKLASALPRNMLVDVNARYKDERSATLPPAHPSEEL